MSRVFLIHWNADEALVRVRDLVSLGHEVSFHADQDSAALRQVRNDPPEAFVIDLRRLPSHGLAVAIWLRQQKKTRHIPIVFIEGDPEKTARARELLPDAAYSKWASITTALQHAIAAPPREPVVPGTMESYSRTPLPDKLGIKAGSRVMLLESPPGFEERLGDLPQGVELTRAAGHKALVILLFVTTQDELEERFQTARDALSEGGRLWILWPKKTSGVPSNLTQKKVRAFGIDAGFVDYKVAAIDATWSGLCFARRKRA